MMEKDYKQEFNDFWKGIVCDKDGNLILDQVMRELSDYSNLIENATIVYDHATGGKISKVNTDPDVVCSVIDDYMNED